MREIKFRAWDKDEKCMVEVNDLFGIPHGITCVSFPSSIPYQVRGLGMIIEPDFILMQYTGLKDKNGVEIYSDDIVYAHANDSHGIIREGTHYYYDEYDKQGIWGWYIEDAKDPNDKEPLFPQTDKYLEVIGNIYENPELLEG
jgi:uncharacterized phage protein (TIGR01671 family)